LRYKRKQAERQNSKLSLAKAKERKKAKKAKKVKQQTK